MNGTADSFRVRQYVMENAPETAAIGGAGYIGLEMADAFRHRGLRVARVVRSEVLRMTFEASLARMVEEETM